MNTSTGYTPFTVMFGREFHPLCNYMAVEWNDANEQEEQLVEARRTIQHKITLHTAWREAALRRARTATELQRKGTDRVLENRIVEARLKPHWFLYADRRPSTSSHIDSLGHTSSAGTRRWRKGQKDRRHLILSRTRAAGNFQTRGQETECSKCPRRRYGCQRDRLRCITGRKCNRK